MRSGVGEYVLDTSFCNLFSIPRYGNVRLVTPALYPHMPEVHRSPSCNQLPSIVGHRKAKKCRIRFLATRGQIPHLRRP